jgi:hypothetical protein
MPDSSSQFRAEFFNSRHVLKRQGALKELAAVQTTPEHKMPL